MGRITRKRDLRKAVEKERRWYEKAIEEVEERKRWLDERIEELERERKL